MSDYRGLTASELSPPKNSRWSRLWRPFWAIPLACIVTSWAAGLLLPSVDSRFADAVPYVFNGGPDGARSVLSTIASAMISVTGVVFSITMVVLQLASSQFSPRVLGGFLSNRTTQFTLGIFTATFVFSLTVLRSVLGGSSDQGEPQFVPQLSVTLAFSLVIASVLLFMAFINYITTTIQVTRVISRIGDETAPVIDRYFPEESVRTDEQSIQREPRIAVTVDGEHGYVTDIDYAALVRLAKDADAVIELTVGHGQTRSAGQGLAIVHGAGADDIDPKTLRGHIQLSTSRDLRVDPSFGVRQLADITARALSPGTNDPTTAVEGLNEMHHLLRPIVARHDPGRLLHDDEDEVRVVWQPQTVGELLRLGFIEPIHYGADAPQVRQRLQEILGDLQSVALPEHCDVLEELESFLQRHAEELLR